MQTTHDWRRHTRETSHPAGAQAPDEVIASSGFTFQLWRLYQHAWLVCLFFPLVSLVSQPQAPLRLAIGIAALVLFCGRLHLADVASSGEPGGASPHKATDVTHPVCSPGHARAGVQPGIWFRLALVVHRSQCHCRSPPPDAQCLCGRGDSSRSCRS